MSVRWEMAKLLAECSYASDSTLYIYEDTISKLFIMAAEIDLGMKKLQNKCDSLTGVETAEVSDGSS